MHSKNIRELFQDFLDKTITPVGLNRLFDHFGTADEGEIRLLIQQEMTFDTEEEADEPDEITQSRLEAIFNKIDERIGVEVDPEYIPRRFSISLVMRYAAVVALLIGLAWLFVSKTDVFKRNIEWKRVSTLYDRKKIVLPDGTNIWLGPRSKLEYPGEFTGNPRQVELSGEAFFDVAKDASRPFIIHSGGLTTSVLGTSFNIRSYEEEMSATVTVVTGRVSVAAGTDPARNLKLSPFEQALFQKQSQSITMRKYPDANKLLDRREGSLDYNGATLTDVIGDLQKIMSYRIVAKSDLSGCVFYGEKKAGDNPLDFLQNVCSVNNLTLNIENDTLVTITGKGCTK